MHLHPWQWVNVSERRRGQSFIVRALSGSNGQGQTACTNAFHLHTFLHNCTHTLCWALLCRRGHLYFWIITMYFYIVMWVNAGWICRWLALFLFVSCPDAKTKLYYNGYYPSKACLSHTPMTWPVLTVRWSLVLDSIWNKTKTHKSPKIDFLNFATTSPPPLPFCKQGINSGYYYCIITRVLLLLEYTSKPQKTRLSRGTFALKGPLAAPEPLQEDVFETKRISLRRGRCARVGGRIFGQRRK